METEQQVRAVQVGDFFEESWGYDQTNVDFYQVIWLSASGKTARLRHVRSTLVSGSGPADYVAPVAGDFDDGVGGRNTREGVLTKRVLFSKWDGLNRPYLNMTSYSNAYLWDLKPAFQTASGWGH